VLLARVLFGPLTMRPDDFNQAISVGHCIKETMTELQEKRDTKTGHTVIPALWCSPIRHSFSSEGISFPYKPAVEQEDNRMACSSSISAFIYVMMMSLYGDLCLYSILILEPGSSMQQTRDVKCVVLSGETAEGCFTFRKCPTLLSSSSGQIQNCIPRGLC
jgi:hypothetical protein